MGTLHEDRCIFMIIYRSVFLRIGNVSNKICTENKNTHFMFSNIFSPKSCRLWDNVEKYCTARQATDGDMAHAHSMQDIYGCRHAWFHASAAKQMRTVPSGIITQRVVVISYRCLGCPEMSPLKIGPIGCTETSIRSYHYSLLNDTEDRSSQLHALRIRNRPTYCFSTTTMITRTRLNITCIACLAATILT